MSVGWHSAYLFPLLFIAFVPLLFLQDCAIGQNTSSNFSIGICAFVSFGVFIVSSTFWLSQYSFFGACCVWLIQSTLTTLVFYLVHLTHKQLGEQSGWLAFVSYFLAFEYFNLKVPVAWSWLNLGNGLAACTNYIQWYEFTGVAGGSLWILLMNVLVFLCLKRWFRQNAISKRLLIYLLLLIMFPIGISYTVLKNYQFPTKQLTQQVAIIQPNMNSYEHKLNPFTKENLKQQINYIKPIFKNLNQQQFDLILLPETVFPYVSNIDSIFQHPANFLLPYLKPEGKAIFGMYLKDEQNHKYNAAISISTNHDYHYHIKNKLVPGVEYLPFSNNGATAFHKQYYARRKPNNNSPNSLDYPTAICYESIFGAALAQQCNYKNNAIIIMTNDGWFDGSSLVQQHQNIAKLRAIENRRYVLRAANSGISSIINHYGKIEKQLNNRQAGALQHQVPLNKSPLTFYQQYTDVLYQLFSAVAIILLLHTFANSFKKKFIQFGIR